MLPNWFCSVWLNLWMPSRQSSVRLCSAIFSRKLTCQVIDMILRNVPDGIFYRKITILEAQPRKQLNCLAPNLLQSHRERKGEPSTSSYRDVRGMRNNLLTQAQSGIHHYLKHHLDKHLYVICHVFFLPNILVGLRHITKTHECISYWLHVIS